MLTEWRPLCRFCGRGCRGRRRCRRLNREKEKYVIGKQISESETEVECVKQKYNTVDLMLFSMYISIFYYIAEIQQLI